MKIFFCLAKHEERKKRNNKRRKNKQTDKKIALFHSIIRVQGERAIKFQLYCVL